MLPGVVAQPEIIAQPGFVDPPGCWPPGVFCGQGLAQWKPQSGLRSGSRRGGDGGRSGEATLLGGLVYADDFHLAHHALVDVAVGVAALVGIAQ